MIKSKPSLTLECFSSGGKKKIKIKQWDTEEKRGVNEEKDMKCFFKWSYVLKKKGGGHQGNALHPPGELVRQIKSLLLCCGQQMHPIKQFQESKDSAVKVAGQFETE